jgi:DNA-binding SARP family transcriptional activator
VCGFVSDSEDPLTSTSPVICADDAVDSRAVSRHDTEQHTDVMQAQHFINGGEFVPAAQLLARLSIESSQAEVTARLDAARLLCVSCAEHIRLAKQLQKAAHQLVAFGRSLKGSGLEDASEPVPPAPVPTRQSEHFADSDADPATEITVKALGPLEITIQGERVAGWRSQKSRTLFQYLVLHAGRPVRREQLIELLWPAHTSGRGRNNLNVCLHGLRNALQRTHAGGQYVVHRDGGYLLNTDFNWGIDCDQFLSLTRRAQAEARAGRIERAIELYERAVAIYRGELFEDETSYEWFELERRSLQEQLLRALDHLAELHLRTSNIEATYKTAQQILRHDACRESAHRFLMRCYSQQQQHSLVARQFRVCTATLRAELGVSPAEETVGLFRQLTSATHQS